MINNFAYLKAGSISEAVKALSKEGTRLHAGGTDLLGCLRDEIFQADTVVSIRGLKRLKGITAGSGGSLTIGALTSIADIASDATVAKKYPVLAQAAAAVGSPQIREQGTLGGNLCQKPRCWYYRKDILCRKKGGDTCYAMSGENQYHAIFGGGPCFFVHPSDTAVALTALGAELTIAGSSGNKTVKIGDFFVSPGKMVEKENILLSNEIVTAISLPIVSETTRSSYRKVRARGAWDFALVSVATVLEFDNDTVRDARIVLGGVAGHPWRVEAAEKKLQGQKLDEGKANEAAEAAVEGAVPLRDNRYKLDIVKGALKESLLALA
ncbi:MAG: xanthine dehydrogenase family protein subunit M [Acidobacteria bacterium]|nr:xanthine dehydrogenase family protein subunit M [Acidobacteriota bacterium]